jgi:hypothetical protein
MPRTFTLPFLVLVAGATLAAIPGCQGGKKSDRQSRSSGAAASGGPDAAPATARFVGFGQSVDARQRTVRYEVAYHSARAARAVRVRLRYQGAAGQALGELPVEVSRPVSAPITRGQRLAETFDLLGQEGPPEGVTGIRIHVEQVTFVDDTTWTAPAAAGSK